jgi:hypothetical protein
MTATAATAAAAAEAAATAATTTTATAATGGTLLGNVHAQRSAFEHCVVQLRDCVSRFCFCRHRDKRESSRSAGFTIRHHMRVGDLSALCKARAQRFRRHVIRKIAHVKSILHVFCSQSCVGRRFPNEPCVQTSQREIGRRPAENLFFLHVLTATKLRRRKKARFPTNVRESELVNATRRVVSEMHLSPQATSVQLALAFSTQPPGRATSRLRSPIPAREDGPFALDTPESALLGPTRPASDPLSQAARRPYRSIDPNRKR